MKACIVTAVIFFILILSFLALVSHAKCATVEEALSWLDAGIGTHVDDSPWARYWIETYQAAKKILWEQAYRTPYPGQVTNLSREEVIYRLFMDSVIDQGTADKTKDPWLKAYYQKWADRWYTILQMIELPPPEARDPVANDSTAAAAKSKGISEAEWIKVYGYGGQ